MSIKYLFFESYVFFVFCYRFHSEIMNMLFFWKSLEKELPSEEDRKHHYKKWRKNRSKFTYRSKSRAFIDSQVAIFILFFWIVIRGIPCNISFLTPEWGRVHKNETLKIRHVEHYQYSSTKMVYYYYEVLVSLVPGREKVKRITVTLGSIHLV